VVGETEREVCCSRVLVVGKGALVGDRILRILRILLAYALCQCLKHQKKSRVSEDSTGKPEAEEIRILGADGAVVEGGSHHGDETGRLGDLGQDRTTWWGKFQGRERSRRGVAGR